MAVFIKPIGAPVAYKNCPVGLFEFQGTYAVMSEYSGRSGRQSYLLESGEMFWGGTNTKRDRDALMVQPCEVAITESGGGK